MRRLFVGVPYSENCPNRVSDSEPTQMDALQAWPRLTGLRE